MDDAGFRPHVRGTVKSETAEQQGEQITNDVDKISNETHVFLLRKSIDCEG